MKNHVVAAFIIYGMYLMGCHDTPQPTQEASARAESLPSLVGAWEYVTSEVVLPDTVITVGTTDDRVGLYLYSESHWAFVGSSPDGGELLHAGRGTYTVDGNRYTEFIQYHTMPEMIGTSVDFEFEIDGDTLKKVGYFPVWEKIKPLAGDETVVRYEQTRVRAREDL